MTPDEFREIALGLPETEERSHMNHPDFRVGGRIFATLSPDLTQGMAKLTPADQQTFVRIDAASFKPASGSCGKGGATMITLASADENDVRSALAAAWRNIAPKTMADRS